MLYAAKQQVLSVLNLYPAWVCRKEFEEQKFKQLNERPVEYAFTMRQFAKLMPRTVLDVGTGTTALPHVMANCGAVVTAIDNVRDYWANGMVNRHFHVIDDDITNTKLTETFDFITCLSVLEHIVEADRAVANLVRLLNPGGHLVLSFPYTERQYVRNVYELPGARFGQGLPYITQSFSRTEIDRWGLNVVEQEYWELRTGESWTLGDQVIPPRKVSASDQHQLSCLLVAK